MKKNKILITGTSRGIGEALAQKFLSEDWEVQGFSRQKNESLKKNLKRKSNYKETIGDLSNIKDVRRFIKKSLMNISAESYEQIVLINNAGILEPIKKIRDCDMGEMLNNFKVNVLGTCSLISLFLNELKEVGLPKMIISISSGAGKTPYQGWGSYCASKAAIDMFSQCAALEEQSVSNPAKVFSIAPGVIETKMQETIRSKSEEEFPLVKRFIELKESGNLQAPAQIAEKYYQFIKNISNYQGPCVFNINDYIEKKS